MNEVVKQAGHYTLKKFTIESYDGSKIFDIKGIIHSFEIHESIKKGSIRGFAKMFDSVGLLHDFPLRGEEFVEIIYKDFYDVEHMEKLFLYSITDVRQTSDSSKDTRWEYTLNFVSRPKIWNEKERIRRAFTGPAGSRLSGGLISEFVQVMYDEYYAVDIPGIFKNGTTQGSSPKPLKIQETEGKQRLVVPNMTPDQTMQFFARRGYSSNSFSQTWHWFENRKNYVFGTNEWLQDEVYTGSFIYKQEFKPDQTPEGQAELQQSIIDIDYGEVVNTINDINSGGYKRTSYEIDIMHNTVEPSEYSFSSEFAGNNPKMQMYHTGPFISDIIEKPFPTQRWIVKDYSKEGQAGGPDVRMNPYYTEIYNKKGSHLYHTNRNSTILTAYGNNMVVAGSTIDLRLIKHTSQDGSEPDKRKSGLYLVESIENIFYEDQYMQKMVLTRNGVGID